MKLKKNTSRVGGRGFGGRLPSVPPLSDPPMLLSKYNPVLTSISANLKEKKSDVFLTIEDAFVLIGHNAPTKCI